VGSVAIIFVIIKLKKHQPHIVQLLVMQ